MSRRTRCPRNGACGSTEHITGSQAHRRCMAAAGGKSRADISVSASAPSLASPRRASTMRETSHGDYSDAVATDHGYMDLHASTLGTAVTVQGDDSPSSRGEIVYIGQSMDGDDRYALLALKDGVRNYYELGAERAPRMFSDLYGSASEYQRSFPENLETIRGGGRMNSIPDRFTEEDVRTDERWYVVESSWDMSGEDRLIPHDHLHRTRESR